MPEEDNIFESNPDFSGIFLFDRAKVQTCLYQVIDNKGKTYGLLQCYEDVNKEVGGVISNYVQARNYWNRKGYDSSERLWKRYREVRDITIHRYGFVVIWEGYCNLSFKALGQLGVPSWLN